MNILFVQTNTNRQLVPLPIGAAMVARQLERDGHRVHFLDLMGERDLAGTARRAAVATRPDLVCYSVRNRDNQWLQAYDDPVPGIAQVCAAVRSATTAPALLGGTAFTTFPRRMMSELGAQYGIAGDALGPISRFVHSLATGRPDLHTPGLVYHDAEGALVTNPFVLEGYRQTHGDHHGLIDRRRYRRCYWHAAVITRAGCPEKCAYCDAFKSFGREFVLREPEDVAQELLKLKRTARVRSAWLVDAGFNRPLDHAKSVLCEIIRGGAQMRLYGVFDPGSSDREFFRLFRQAGGVGFTMFAESLADPVLAALGKPFGAAEIFRDAALMRDEGVAFMYLPTFGGPSETRATVEETLRRAPSLGAVFTEFGIGWRIQPDTPLQRLAIQEGVIDANDDLWDARFYVSSQTPIPWLAKRLRAFRWRHPSLYGRILPFMLRNMGERPWRRGPSSA